MTPWTGAIGMAAGMAKIIQIMAPAISASCQPDARRAGAPAVRQSAASPNQSTAQPNTAAWNHGRTGPATS
jgi:hypothetical protein